MININEILKPIITREHILENISPIEIYCYYIDDKITINSAMSSPFREDNIPSFGIYEKKSNGELLYNDFILGGGDCFQFVKYLFDYSTMYEVYSRIGVDFNLDNKYKCKPTFKGKKYNESKDLENLQPLIKKRNIDINFRIRKWEQYDINFWESFGISKSTLLKYKVYPISHIFTKNEKNEKIIKADKLAYVFIEYKDNKRSLKIYQPNSKYKWINTHDSSVWQGWTQIDRTKFGLIITKSLKDVMSISEILGENYSSVSLQSEKTLPKDTVINELKNDFENIFVLYDNDFDKEINWGKKFGKKIAFKYDFYPIFIPDEYECKDFSDLVKKFGKEKSKEILSKIIMDHFDPPF